jgi:dehydrogenase/reductase SDR family protein 7B
MDDNTAAGVKPADLANQILDAVEAGEHEVISCGFTAQLAIYLRRVCPNVFFWLMARRARKTAAAEVKAK